MCPEPKLGLEMGTVFKSQGAKMRESREFWMKLHLFHIQDSLYCELMFLVGRGGVYGALSHDDSNWSLLVRFFKYFNLAK